MVSIDVEQSKTYFNIHNPHIRWYYYFFFQLKFMERWSEIPGKLIKFGAAENAYES